MVGLVGRPQTAQCSKKPIDPKKTDRRRDHQTAGIVINSAIDIQVDEVHDCPGHAAAETFHVEKPHRGAEGLALIKKIGWKEQHQQRKKYQKGDPDPIPQTHFIHKTGLKLKTGVSLICIGLTPVVCILRMQFI